MRGYPRWYWYRIDGPAVVYKNGDKWWYTNGNLNRLDGPAIEAFGGEQFWYINSKYFLHYKHYLKAVRKLIDDETYFMLVLTYGTE